MKKEPMPADVSVWRYGIISPLLHRSDGETLEEMLNLLSNRVYILYDGREMSYSPETLRKWLYSYRSCGLDGLKEKNRNDKGHSSVPEEIAKAIRNLRKDHPKWTIMLILKELKETNIWNGRKPSISSIYRFCQNYNLQRNSEIFDKIYRNFEYLKFGQLWMLDFMHAHKMYVGSKKKKVYLQLIIDDATRWAVGARFHASESIESVVYDLMCGVRKFGIPLRLYSDNGSAYKSGHIKTVCARLQIDLIHNPVRRPQGRGKNERIFRTIRDQFLSRYELNEIGYANKMLEKWVSEYHNTIHSSLKTTPLNKRMSVDDVCRKVPEVSQIESLFRAEKKCSVYKNGTIQLKKQSYEVPGYYPGSKVTVYYMPWDMSNVYYGDEMKPARLVDVHRNAYRRKK